MEDTRQYPGQGPAAAELVSERIANEIKSLSESFGQAWADAAEIYEKLEKAGKKGPPRFCYISFLRSSVVEKRPLYRLDLYDENELLDFEECSVQWDVSNISHYIYEDLPLTNKAVLTDEDWKDYEVEQLWVEEAEKYHTELGKKMRIIVDSARQPANDQIQFQFGEYMDQSITV